MGFEQTPPADVVEIQADQVDLLARRACDGLSDLFVWNGFVSWNWLICKGFRVMLVEQTLGLSKGRVTVFGVTPLIHIQPEIVGTLAPIEDMRLAAGISPFNQRFPPRLCPECECPGRRFLGNSSS